MIERIYLIYIVQDDQKGCSARPQRLKKAEVEVKVEHRLDWFHSP